MKTLLLSFGLLCVVGIHPLAAQKIVGGPYVVNDGQRSATVVWVVEEGQTQFGTTATSLAKTVPVLRSKKVVLPGLLPGQTIFYQVFPGDDGNGSFKTPPVGTSQFQFVVYGDTRTRHDAHQTVINGILKYSEPDFLVNTGDFTEDGSDNSLWEMFFRIERELLRKTAIFPTPGNHEHSSSAYYDFMNAKPYYSFDWGQAHFSLINSDLASLGTTEPERTAAWTTQTRWLEDDLKSAQNSAFRFLVAHHGPITAMKARQGQNQHMIALEPMLERYRVAAGLFGHDHSYQHYLRNGVHYFISGGGGAPLYDVDSPPAGITQKVMSTENFMIIRVNGTTASVEVLKPNGEKIDSAQLGK